MSLFFSVRFIFSKYYLTKRELFCKVLLDKKLIFSFPQVKNRLQEFRKARNLSQSELAQALEISRQAVSGFESGKFTPSLEMAFKIAQLLEVTVEEIFLSK